MRIFRSFRRTRNHLTFATQGGEFSYHAVAARTIAQDPNVIIDAKKRFGEVVVACRNHHPGLGVMAISSVAGTVEDSAREIVRARPSALPPIVDRVDVPVEMAMIGSQKQSIEDLGRFGIHCLAQKPAWEQTEEFRKKHTPWLKREFRHESTLAIAEMIAQRSADWVAIGPTFAAEPMGGVVLARQINPPDSITSFYVLQRDLRDQILPIDPAKTAHRTVISLAHPEGEGEIEKCWEMAERVGIQIARFIPFDIGDFTKHNPDLRRGGGLLEVSHDLFDEPVTEWCARVNGIHANDGVRGPFDTIKLGSYRWYPEEPVNIRPTIVSTNGTQPDA